MKFGRFLFIIFFLFVSNLSIPSIQQNFAFSPLEYNISQGENITYIFINFIYNEEPSYSESWIDNAGKEFNITYREGFSFTFKVSRVNVSSEEIMLYYTLSANNKSAKEDLYVGGCCFMNVLRKTTTNRSYWEDLQLDYEKNANNDMFLQNDTFILRSQSKRNNYGLETEIISVYNWKTGWLQYYYFLMKLEGKIQHFYEVKTPDYDEQNLQLILSQEPTLGYDTFSVFTILIIFSIILRKKKSN